ncbi:protein tyrosine kinase [Ostertagia ostertagi]
MHMDCMSAFYHEEPLMFIKDLVGSGNFCKVYKGLYEREENDVIQVAIKICHGASIDTMTEEAKKARESMMHEAHLMSYYVHKHVIQLYGVACDHYPVMIVMEFCPGGNLQDHLQKYTSQIEVGELICYASETSRGMRYLHSKSCVHRDLAARNCLISETGQIKISDFGLSKIAEELGGKGGESEGEPPLEQIPLRWMAPECLRRPQLWSLKSDIWSYGVVGFCMRALALTRLPSFLQLLYEIFNEGQKPWPNDPPKKIATLIRKGKMLEFPAKTPQAIKDMVAKIWSLNPDQRPTMDEIAKKITVLRREIKLTDPSKAIIKQTVSVSKSRSETNADDDDESLRSKATKSVSRD